MGAAVNMRRRASPLVVFALIAALAGVLVLLVPARHPPTPEVRFTLLDGRTISITEWRGHPVVVAFWATSCQPCVEELPDLIRLYRDLNPYGLEFVAVAMPYDPPLAVQNLARDFTVPYPIAIDVNGSVLRGFENVQHVPTTLLLDPLGNVMYRQVGKLNTDRVRALVAPFLSSLPRSTDKPTT